MAFFSISGITISGLCAVVPENTVDNSDLDILSEAEKKVFIARVGIRKRRIAPDEMCASDLCIHAARRLFSVAALDPAAVGALVFVTQTPDYILPGNSVLAQRELGLSPDTYLLDMNQGCAGYIYGLSVIAGLMRQAAADYGLLLVGDTISRLISREDRSTWPIFSDAGSATLLQKQEGASGFHFNLGANGHAASAIYVEGGGARHPFGEDSLRLREFQPGIKRAPVHLTMEGIDVLQQTYENVVPNIRSLLERSGCDQQDIDYFVFHQANKILNDGILKKLDIPAEKAPESLSAFGNTSCATIPLTLVHRLGATLREGRRQMLLSGFGVGFSWGSALLDLGPLLCPDLIEIKASA